MKESPVFTKHFELVSWLIPITIKFPREQRFVVANALQKTAMESYESLVRAGTSTETTICHDHLRAVMTDMTILRFYVRLSERLGCMTTKQYEHFSELSLEIGRLVQAWMKTVCVEK